MNGDQCLAGDRNSRETSLITHIWPIFVDQKGFTDLFSDSKVRESIRGWRHMGAKNHDNNRRVVGLVDLCYAFRWIK